MSRAVALALILISIAVLAFPSGARAAAWTCQAESTSGGASGGGASRKEAEDRALAFCAANSVRFSECRIVTCHRGHGS
jgi:hypothetical protein